MGAEDKVARASAPKAFIQFSGDDTYTRNLSCLIKYFLEGSMYRVEYLTKDESTTLKVFEND